MGKNTEKNLVGQPIFKQIIDFIPKEKFELLKRKSQQKYQVSDKQTNDKKKSWKIYILPRFLFDFPKNTSIIADILKRMNYMERRGSGFKVAIESPKVAIETQNS